MNKVTGFGLALLFVLGPASAVLAHHGTAGYYDHDKLVRIEGVVTEFHFRNPHAGLFLAAKNEAGEDIVYSLEMGSPGQLAKSGYTRRTFKPGDKVIADMNPAYNSPTSGQLYIGRGSIWINGVLFSSPDETEE